jgi:hypothetical protein
MAKETIVRGVRTMTLLQSKKERDYQDAPFSLTIYSTSKGKKHKL